jgi:long-chain fatty acid transport protein
MTKQKSRPLRFVIIAATILGIVATSTLHATNGMDMEGYGPVATAMGGASFAYDNGTAGLINNPATLGLMSDQARLDLALGILGPHLTVTSPSTAPNIFGVPANQSADSSAKAFFMPAMGYTRRSGKLVYGLGVFGQGGMGCEYDANSWRGLGFGLKNRTEVSVGRVIVPLVYQVNEQLQIGATADFMWAGMDLKMAMSGNQFFDLVMPTSQRFGRASGTIVQSFGQIMSTMPAGTRVDYAYFNFSNRRSFTGEARGYGYSGKVGLVYTPSKTLSFGLTYHAQSVLSDLTAQNNTLSFQLNVPGMGQVPQTLTGDYRVRNFQWPAMLGVGVAWHPAPHWMVAADVREVFWKRVMNEFDMSFVASPAASNGPFAGQTLDAVLFQDWRDQTVLQLGAAYQATEQLTLRFGGNVSNNPVPDTYLNCLFPAIVTKHLTAGFGWQFDAHSSVDTSFTYGFKASAINGAGAGISHSQTNFQIMYSYRF